MKYVVNFVGPHALSVVIDTDEREIVEDEARALLRATHPLTASDFTLASVRPAPPAAEAKHLIVCRAHVSEDCYAGTPTKRQFGEDLPMSEDNTFDGESIVCDACYTELQDFTRSGHALNSELPEAIATMRGSIGYAKLHAEPERLVAEAAAAAAAVTPGTPYHRSSLACKRIAEREVERRKQNA